MSDLLHLTDANFNKQLSASKLPVLVDFWGPACPPCELLGPIFQELADAYRERVVFAKLDVSENMHIATNQNIRGTPTLILFQGSAAIDTIIGLRPKQELQKWLDSILQTEA